MRKKVLGTLLVLVGLFGFVLLVYRVAAYQFEYDAVSSPVDYGRWNFFSYFTIQSNIAGYIYLVLVGLAFCGVQKVEAAAYNPLFGAFVTTYVVMAGLVFCAGLPLGMSPAFEWDTWAHGVYSFMQIFYHMVMPVIVLVLWFLPVSQKPIPYSKSWLFYIYPFAYSVFSILRGTFGGMHYYPYPFYNAEFFDGSWALMIGGLVVGCLIFVAAGLLFIWIHNKRIEE